MERQPHQPKLLCMWVPYPDWVGIWGCWWYRRKEVPWEKPPGQGKNRQQTQPTHWAGIKPKPQQWKVSTPKCLSLLLLWFSWQIMCLGSCPLTKWEWKIYLLAGKSTHPKQEEGSFSSPVNVHVPCFILSSDQVDHAIWVLDHFSHRLNILQVIILSAITFIHTRLELIFY